MGERGSSARQALPAELSSLVGRAAEVARALALLAAERLVTITGPAGMGKTRIALRTVRELCGASGADVVWADPSRLRSSAAAAGAAELGEGFEGREVLLVLDGCEQLGERAGELVGELLARWPRVRILATSQRILGVVGEALLAVGPLTLPAAPEDPDEPCPVARVAASDAVRLYVERARGADPRFELTEHNAGAVAALCVALDGIPAALELAPALLAEPGAAGRYRLPLTVRAYAARRLARDPRGDGATVVRRHHERCRITAERAAQLWRSGAQLEARALALRELPELRLAMDPRSPAGPAGALEIAVSLWFLWSACGLVEEGRGHLERALARHPAPRPARALWLASWLVASVGEASAADPLLVEAWATAVQEGEDTVLAYLAHVRGTAALWRDRPDEAAEEYRDALGLLPAEPEFGPGRRALESALAMALAYTDPAAVPFRAGASDGPDLWARSWAGYAQALLQRREGRPALARTWLLRSLEAQFALGDRLGQALSVELLAQLEADLGRYEPAARLLGSVSGYRPTSACPPRAERTLRLRLTPEAFRAAHAEGARTPLRRLLPEL
ncbi:hypothetical protein [Streptomyces katrae]|uniref:hypothetical protein n=1 Tax=Streptomyces katrae TaxID=68223 RepID=UPI000695B565|nr:hypothetical protein [Streptomyces katrae]